MNVRIRGETTREGERCKRIHMGKEGEMLMMIITEERKREKWKDRKKESKNRKINKERRERKKEIIQR